MADLFNIQLESDLTEFTSTVTDGGDLSWSASAALGNTQGGMAALINDTNAIYGQYDITLSTSKLRWRFYIDPNSATMASGDTFRISTVSGNAPAGSTALVDLHYDGSNYQIRCTIRNDTGAGSSTSYGTITDGPHCVEVYLQQAATSSSADGSIELWIDGTSIGSVTGVDNYDVWASSSNIRIGAISSIDAGTSGTIYFDEFRANDDGGEISPAIGDIFNIQLESDLTEFDSTVTDVGDLSWSASAALGGSSGGMAALIDDTTSIYGQYNITSPSSGKLRFRFYIDPNSVTMASGDTHFACIVNISASPWQAARVWLRYSSGNYQMSATIPNDAGSGSTIAYANITDAPHYVEVYLQRATTNVSADGSIEMWIDGTSIGSVTGVDNYDIWSNIISMMLGPSGGIDAGTSGTIYYDEFRANDDGTEIGPLGVATATLQFETDLSEFGTINDADGDMTQSASAAMNGTSGGLSIAINDTNPAYGSVMLLPDTVVADGVITTTFYIDVNSMTMPNNYNNVTILQINSTGPYSRLMIARLGHQATWYSVTPYAFSDAGSTHSLGSITIPNSPTLVTIKVYRATSSSASDGYLTIRLNTSTTYSTAATIDNYDTFANLSSLNFGIVTGVLSSTSGTFYLDELTINGAAATTVSQVLSYSAIPQTGVFGGMVVR